MKISIDQELVRRLHSEGVSNNAIMKGYKIPVSSIVAILSGIDRPFYTPKVTKSGKNAVEMCTNCHIRKKIGRYLCYHCWKKNEGVVGDM